MSNDAVASLTDAAYKGPALEVDRSFYGTIGRETASRTLVESFQIRDMILSSGMDTGVIEGFEKLDELLGTEQS